MKNNKQARKPLRPGIIVLDILIVALVVAGLYLILKPLFIHYLQDRATAELAEQFLQGEGTIEIDPDDFPVEGEDLEYFADVEAMETTQPGTTVTGPTAPSGETGLTPAPSTTKATEPAKVTITAIGRVVIPAINVNMPVAKGIEKYTLRVAIGHYSRSAGFGQPGNCILFGHRMYAYGRHFNRLGEMKTGDQIILEDKNSRYVYEVDQIDTVTPVALIDELYKKVEGSRIMLVTCTPIRVASHRLLVKGRLVRTEPLG